MKLCKHQPHRVIDWIKAPRYHDNRILIDESKITPKIEHYIFRFTDEAPKKKYGWFYLSGKVIRRYGTQRNGRIMVYAVPLTKTEKFIPDKKCKCMQERLLK